MKGKKAALFAKMTKFDAFFRNFAILAAAACNNLSLRDEARFLLEVKKRRREPCATKS